MMREILRDYREYIAAPYDGAVYVKPALYSSYPYYAFIITPFNQRTGKQFMVNRSWDNMYWIFMEIPF